MTNRNKIIVVIVLIVLAYGVGRYLQPAKIETRTETVIKEVEVTKKDVEIIKKKKTNTDGSIEEEEITRDKSTETRNKNEQTRSETVVENLKPQWRIRGEVGYDFKNNDNVYGAGFEKRWMGPVSVGLWGNNKQQAGLSASIEF